MIRVVVALFVSALCATPAAASFPYADHVAPGTVPAGPPAVVRR